jgi:N-acetylneuraminic acid mutarotase
MSPSTRKVQIRFSGTFRRFETLESRQLLAAMTPFPTDMPMVPDHAVLFANFDNGGEGVAFHDVDKRNLGGDYRRTNIGVDILRNDDTIPTNVGNAPGTGRTVGHTRAGEWLNYMIDVATTGTYDFALRFASSAGGTAHLAIDGARAGASIQLTSTGGWETWTTLEQAGINLAAGKHVLSFVIDSSVSGGDVANFHWFRFDEAEDLAGGNAAAVKWPTVWDRVADAPAARFEAMSHTFDGKLYVFGGFVNEKFQVSREYSVYDADTNTWKTLGTLPGGMAETHATPVDDGKYIYFVGGFAGDLGNYDGATQRASNRVYRFNPATNKWTLLTLTPKPQGAGGTAIIDRQLHFFGGNPDDRVTNIGNHYVLNLDKPDAGWTTAAAMPDSKDHFSTVVLNGKIYTVGGEYGHDVDFNTQDSVYVYDPKRDSWKRLANLPIASGHAEGSSFAYDGRIIFAGGQTKTDNAATDRVFAYDPAKDRWSELSNLPFFLQGAAVTVIGKKVIVMLGARYTQDPLAMTFVGDL